MTDKILDRIEALCKLPAPSGKERSLLSWLENEIGDVSSDTHFDKRGNLIAHLKNSVRGGVKLLLTVHVDEPGLIVTSHCESGQLKVFGLGNIKPESCVYREVEFPGGATGVLVPENGENKGWNDMTVDIAAECRAEAERLVPAGTIGAFAGKATRNGNYITGFGIHAKAAAAALSEAVKQADKLGADIYLAFLVESELGFRGAKTAAFELEPDIAVVLDGADMKRSAKADEGIIFKLIDGKTVYSKELTEKFIKAAESTGVSYRTEVSDEGGGEAYELQFIKSGIKCGGVSLPVKYKNTFSEMISIKDINSLFLWLKGFLEENND